MLIFARLAGGLDVTLALPVSCLLPISYTEALFDLKSAAIYIDDKVILTFPGLPLMVVSQTSPQEFFIDDKV